jgi:hypothetical protein
MNMLKEEQINENDINECIKCLEAIKACEIKRESIFNHLIVQSSSEQIQNTKIEDLYKRLWSEIEQYLRAYQDMSNNHKILYQHVKATHLARLSICQQQQTNNPQTQTLKAKNDFNSKDTASSFSEINLMNRKIHEL